jgi:hypothetical protein
MILKDSLELKIFFLALFKIQNGAEMQDGRQTIKCSRFVKNDATLDYLKKYHRTKNFSNYKMAE